MKKLQLIFLLALIALSSSAAEKMTFSHRYNPTMGVVHSSEAEQRSEICLNGKWQFMPLFSKSKDDFKLPSEFKWSDTAIKIPSPWNVNDYTADMAGSGGDFINYPSYPKEWTKATIAWMRKSVTLPKEWKGEQIKLLFKGVLGNTVVYVNGTKVGENFDLFLPFEFDVTELLKEGENEILVGVCRASLYNLPRTYGIRPYVGGSAWAKSAAGIWQDVYLLATPKVNISDTFIKPRVSEDKLVVEVDVTNTTTKSTKVDISAEVYEWINLAGKSIVDAPVAKSKLSDKSSLTLASSGVVTLAAGETKSVTLSAEVAKDGLKYWTPDTPNLYGVVLKANSKGKCVDTKYQRFGWREFKIKGTELQLNGEKIVLKGDSWHFMGVPQLTRRYAWAWYTMLKEANANAVRPHAQVYPDFYLDMADEMGICVLDETAIWSSDGCPKVDSEEYWSRCIEHVERFVNRDKNHPSVFGWSVCNEVIVIVMNAYKGPKELVQRQVDEVNRWCNKVLELDDTRDWVSGDGETQHKTVLPTMIGHYGGEGAFKNWSSKGMPWGIGEASKAYFGTPMQMSEINGERAFESAQGRMEALATECYDMLRLQDELKASYQSVFNIVWYGLKPLNIGKPNQSYPSRLDEGIFMTHFEEGIPGVQPERLGAYCTTLNPGYDPSLPLYKPWPMFDAIKAANGGVEDYKVTVEPTKRNIKPITEDAVAVSTINVIGDKEKWSKLLASMGAKYSVNGKINSNSLVIVDAKEFSKSDIETIKRALKLNARIYITLPTPQSVVELNKILPAQLALRKFNANSLIVNQSDILIKGLDNRTLYFSELLKRGESVLDYTLTKPCNESWSPLVVTCKADWQAWNYRQEPIKTAMLYRSEFERATEMPVISKYKGDEATIYINTADWSRVPISSGIVTKRILQNLGVDFHANATSTKVIDKKGTIHSALHTTVALDVRFGAENEVLRRNYLKEEKDIRATLNTNNGSWGIDKATDGVFKIEGGKGNKVPFIHYAGFWVFSPRSLSNLLAEPDMPAMDLKMSLPNAMVYINGKPTMATKSDGDTFIQNVMFDKGWNYVLIKTIQKPNSFADFTITFESDSDEYLQGLDGVLEK